jgi:hypothetical protein
MTDTNLFGADFSLMPSVARLNGSDLNDNFFSNNKALRLTLLSQSRPADLYICINNSKFDEIP